MALKINAPRHSGGLRPQNQTATETAERFLAGVTTRNIVPVPVSRILADPNQPRKLFDPEEIKGLGESLKQDGQQQPIKVERLPEDPLLGARYMVVIGERRFRAAQAAGIEFLDAEIIEEPLEPLKKREIQIAENLEREDLTQGELCQSIYELKSQFKEVTYKYLADNTFRKLARGNARWVENRYHAWNRSAKNPAVRALLTDYPDTLSHVALIQTITDQKLQKRLIEMTREGASFATLTQAAKAHRELTQPEKPSAAPPAPARFVQSGPGIEVGYSSRSYAPHAPQREAEAQEELDPNNPQHLESLYADTNWDDEPTYTVTDLGRRLEQAHSVFDGVDKMVAKALEADDATPEGLDAIETRLLRVEQRAAELRIRVQALRVQKEAEAVVPVKGGGKKRKV